MIMRLLICVFGQCFDYNSLLGIATGALVGTMIPSYSQFANGMAEIGLGIGIRGFRTVWQPRPYMAERRGRRNIGR